MSRSRSFEVGGLVDLEEVDVEVDVEVEVEVEVDAVEVLVEVDAVEVELNELSSQTSNFCRSGLVNA